MSPHQILSNQHIGVFVVVKNPLSELLLGKRKNAYKAGEFGFPGGRLEYGESLEACAGRELLEETSLRGKSFEYLGVIRDGQGEYDFIHFGFLCTSYSGSLNLVEPDKCEGWDWYSMANLPSSILRGHKSILPLLVKRKNQYNNIIDLYK